MNRIYDPETSKLVTKVGKDTLRESYMAYEAFMSDITKENRINKIRKLFNI